MSHSQNIQEEVKRYYKVFAALMILTVATVAVANWHLGIVLGVTIALIIATLKASLVVSFFMHLIAERKAIYVLMGFTLFFFISMIGLIVHGSFDLPQRSEFLHYPPAITMELHDKGHSEENTSHAEIENPAPEHAKEKEASH